MCQKQVNMSVDNLQCYVQLLQKGMLVDNGLDHF